MIQTKTFFVTGEVKYVNGLRTHNLASIIDATVNEFLPTVTGEVVDVQVKPETSGAYISALIVILFDPAPVAEEKTVKAEEKPAKTEGKKGTEGKAPSKEAK